jgi:hypothetical protein
VLHQLVEHGVVLHASATTVRVVGKIDGRARDDGVAGQGGEVGGE